MAEYSRLQIKLTTETENWGNVGLSADDYSIPILTKTSILDECNSATGWTVINNDTLNLDTNLNHVYGTASLSFDKVNGAGNTVFAGIQKTITSTDIEPYLQYASGLFLGSMYLSSIANVSYLWFRVGTDSSNYAEWRVADTQITAGEWNALRGIMRSPYTSAGNGMDTSAITYMAVGVAFDAETNTLSEILVDALMISSGIQVSADINTSVTTSAASPNIRLIGYGGSISTGSGNLGSGTLRVAVASDDVNLSAIKTAVQLIDDTVYAEDAGFVNGNKGISVLGVRNEDADDFSGTDKDYIPIALDAKGHVFVRNSDETFSIVIGTTTSGGTDTYYDSDLDEAKVAVKASAGNIYGIHAFNTTDAPLFLQLFNLASGDVTVGTTPPTNQYVIPGNANSDGAGFVVPLLAPKTYGTAITVACSTNSEGNNAPAAGACIVNIEYK